MSSKHPNIEDLAVKYQVVSDAAILDRMRGMRAMTQSDSEQESQPEAEVEEKRRKLLYQFLNWFINVICFYPYI